MSQLAGRHIPLDPEFYRPASPKVISTPVCLNSRYVETKTWRQAVLRAVDMDEAVDYRPSGAMEGGVHWPPCLSRPETQEDVPTEVPRPLERCGRHSRGQEEASKLSHSLTFLQLLVQQPADIKAFMPL